MRDPDPVVVLACGHVQTIPNRCATTDCPNYDRLPRWPVPWVVSLGRWKP